MFRRLLAVTTLTGMFMWLATSCSNTGETYTPLESSLPPDTTGPHLITFSPPDGDTWVSINEPMTIRFTEDLDPESVSEQSFVITPDVKAARQVCRTEAACTVWTRLSYSTTYDVTVTTAVTDTVGNAIDSTVRWSFRTREPPPPPIITGFSPQSGPISTPVTLYGSGFDTILYENHVWFGAESAFVAASTDTTIATLVPLSATSGIISVRNQVAYDTAAGQFQILPPPDSLLGTYRGSFLYIEQFETSHPDSFLQYVTIQFYVSEVYVMLLDVSKQPESARLFCDMAGSYNFVNGGILLDVDDNNWTKLSCDTTRTPAGFYGATTYGDTVSMINYQPGRRLLKRLTLVPQ